jgi:hypothetical protein
MLLATVFRSVMASIDAIVVGIALSAIDRRFGAPSRRSSFEPTKITIRALNALASLGDGAPRHPGL